MNKRSKKPQTRTGNWTRRKVIKGIGAAGLGTLVAGPFSRRASAQSTGPITASLWINDQPQQIAWYQKRAKLFMELNPNIKIDLQMFPFGELGKKISVAYATGTAPDGFMSADWFMPFWLDKNVLAPLDLERLGYSSLAAFEDDHSAAAAATVIKDDKVYGFPTWFYGFLNCINQKHFRDAGLDPDKDAPQTWEQFGEIAERLTIKEGDRFVRQGAKFAMHSPQWTMIQFNPMLLQCGGAWFDSAGKSAVNSEAGVKAMTLRASLVRQYGAEDPADTLATNPLPQMDFLKERCSMFLSPPLPLAAIQSQNAEMYEGGHYRAAVHPGVEAGKGYASAYGFMLVVNAQAPQSKQEVLHDYYKFFMADPVAMWNDTEPFSVARKSGWTNDPAVKSFPQIDEIIRAKDTGVFLPRSLVYNEMADAMHRAVQNIMLNNADIQASLDEAAAEIDRATAAFSRG